MSKLVIGVVAAIVAAGAVVGGIVFYNNSQKQNADNTSGVPKTSSKDVKLNDPEGVYKLFSDPSITTKPANDVKFGNGQILTWQYDGSKSEHDKDATVSYQLFYIQDDGKVQPMGGGNVEGKGSGTLTLKDKVFNSAAKDHKGFLELTVTWGASFDGAKYTSHQEKLGMYSVDFHIAR